MRASEHKVGAASGPAVVPETGFIALCGMGCRFPGAKNLREMWDLLISARDAVGNYPGGRFPQVDAFMADAAASAEDAAMAAGGFLEEIDRFDAAAFELSPREAMYLDPQHRLLLETAWAALEDAGQSRQDPKTRTTGVFVGLWASDFENVLYGSGADLEFYAMTGSGSYGASGRLSFTFGFDGPSVSVDAACSSSLVTVHMACQSLLSGECDMALAGGANAILAVESTKMFTKAGMLARDGRCKFGSGEADGFVRSEGAGMVVLKRLEDAVAAGDPVRAVIRGGAVSNDGRTSGTLMTPSREGQRQTLRRAWAAAGVGGKDIRYFEAHGTGTAVGDPVEVGAIADALNEAGATEPCWIGSIKSNIGHTESAAGIAGLIKTVLALEHRLVPKSRLAGELNPNIDWEASPLRLLTEPLDLSDESTPVIAGVSSFALTGTNAHLVVQEYRSEKVVEARVQGTFLVPVSARSAGALNELLLRYDAFAPESGGLGDVAYTASLRRRHDVYRGAVVCESVAELNQGAVAARGEEAVAVREGRRRVVFVTPGQGSQWTGMARELFAQEPEFKQMLERCDAAIKVETRWSLIEILLGSETEEALRQIEVVQPVLFSLSVSLAALWRSWGIVPDAVIGHSMGEVAAAFIAGALNLEDAAAVICRRSRLMKTVRGAGAMLTVEMPERNVEDLMLQFGGGISVAASNSPETTIVSGNSEAITRLQTMLAEREVFCRLIKVDVASHSAQVDPILGGLREALKDLQPETCKVPLFSTVTGGYLTGSEMDAEYWAANLRRPVGYANGIESLASDGFDVFVELSPHPVLLAATEATLRGTGRVAVAVASTRREKPERREMLASLGALYKCGCDVAWDSFYAEQARCVALPEYPFQRERCWPELEELEVGAAGKRTGTRFGASAAHPLLGARSESAMQPGSVVWEIVADPAVLPYLLDHRVHGAVVFPAAAQVELVLEALRAEVPGSDFAVAAMQFESAMSISEDDSNVRGFQLGLRRKGDGFEFQIFGRGAGRNEEWTRHSSGKAELRENVAQVERVDVSKTTRASMLHIDKQQHYRVRTRAGIAYGSAFQLVEEAWCGAGESLLRIGSAEGGDAGVGKYLVHPAWLDNCFQALQLAQPDGEEFLFDDTSLPVSIERMEIFAPIPATGDLFCHALVTTAGAAAGKLSGDLRFADRNGTVLAVVRGFGVQRISAAMEERAGELLTEIAWQPYELPTVTQAGRGALVVIFCDTDGVGEALAGRVEAAGGRVVVVRQGTQFGVRNGGARGREYGASANRADEVRRVFADLVARGERPDAVVHLWGPTEDQSTEDGADRLLDAQKAGAYFVPWLVQAISACNWSAPPRLWLVTGGGVLVGDSLLRPKLASAAMWGVGAVAAVEHPELQASLVDLSSAIDGDETGELARLVLSDTDEDRIAIRGAKIFVERFVPATGEDRTKSGAQSARPPREDEEYSIEVPFPGSLEGLLLQARGRVQPGPGEVAIEVIAAGLNFVDVAKALGIYPGLDPAIPARVGAECAGKIVEVGPGVTEFKPGDEVVAIANAPSRAGLLASKVCLPEAMVFHKPAALSMEEAAALPMAYLTGYHSLVELAHLRKGEWVLVPSAAGGVGLAAIEIAHRAGAHVIATASTVEKRDYLRSIGVEHVLASRTLEFADEVMRLTEGRGVDIVMNSLTGEYISKGLEVLRPFGRFIELGKRDIHDDRQLGLKIFRNNISYHAVDMAGMLEQRGEYVAGMLRTILNAVSAGELKALPVKVFSAAEPAGPFQYMAQSLHIGKVVVRMERDVRLLPTAKTKLFREDRTYLIAGGMGGVGSTVAEWMAANGAGCLVLVSRREESEKTRAVLKRIEASGARAVHAKTDICDRAAVVALMASMRGEMPPVAGVVQAATVIDDALLTELSPSRFDGVMGPKVKGTWNLYDVTAEDNLDFMVLFSSIASVYPQPGHGNYAAANAFMDSFARWARAGGRKVTSINWGGWEQIGLARETGTGRSISGYAEQGFGTMSAGRALSALRRAIETDVVQAIACPVDLEQSAEFFGLGRVPPVLRGLLADVSRNRSGRLDTAIQIELAESASLSEALGILQGYLIQELGRVLKLPAERIGRETVFGSIGLDSLMTLELVRRLKTGLGVAVPTTAVFNHPTAALLAAEIAKRMQLHLETKAFQEDHGTAAVREMTTAVVADEMSDEDALQALLQPMGER